MMTVQVSLTSPIMGALSSSSLVSDSDEPS
jgi:hypothetical protein